MEKGEGRDRERGVSDRERKKKEVGKERDRETGRERVVIYYSLPKVVLGDPSPSSQNLPDIATANICTDITTHKKSI